MARIEAMNSVRQQDDDPDLVADVDDLPGDGRAHDRRPRRPQARARLRVGVDGRAQARRVRADAHLPWPRRLGEGALMADEAQEPPHERRRPRSRPAADGAPPRADAPRRPPRRAERDRSCRRARRPRRAEARAAQGRADAKTAATAETSRRASRRRGREGRRRRRTRTGAAAPRRRPAGGRVAPPVVRAQAKYVRTSARKARLVCDHIRGKSVEEARAILAFTPRAVAKDWSKLLESAVANAEHNHELVGEDLKIDAGLRRRGPDAQAVPAARHGPRDPDPQAHQPPHDLAHAEGVQ